jgi:hypothetical protein
MYRRRADEQENPNEAGRRFATPATAVGVCRRHPSIFNN